ncbi:helix-turn-helix domain-containing protein [Brevibacillus halotolerans]|uniref:helix-turn-helix domain-containing protein n=1 Tax=Brevibacillus halotolerans TaxID=1507437 RepID=UPI001BB32A46|nr:helix-turn-helix domain-containing protein [Brevibacillus halotolerans]
MEKFGPWFKALRESKRMTVDQLSNISDVSIDYITEMEEQERFLIEPEAFRKLASALEMDFVDLISKASFLAKREDRPLYVKKLGLTTVKIRSALPFMTPDERDKWYDDNSDLPEVKNYRRALAEANIYIHEREQQKNATTA